MDTRLIIRKNRKTSSVYRKVFVTVSAFLLVILLSFNIKDEKMEHVTQDGGFLKKLLEQLNVYNKHLPEERVYMQFDKPMYSPGDTIWFSAYLRDGVNMKPSQVSDILNVELIDPKGNIAKSLKLIVKKGKAAGDFLIENELPGGIYKIKAYTNWQLNYDNPYFFEKELQIQKVILPRLKMKLDFERKAFGAGDQVIAKLSVNTNENRPLAHKQFNYKASLQGNQIVAKSLTTDGAGICFIMFKLPEKLETNDGILNVMIDYEGQTESISRSIPIVLNHIALTFYPEGGDLISGFENTLAFRALNEFDKPADIQGFIIDNDGNKITEFESFHQGMGAVNFTPEKGKKYFAQISKPEGISQSYELPEAFGRGYVLRIDNADNQSIKLNIKSTEQETLSLIAQVRGEAYYSGTFNAKAGNNQVEISTAKFPAGVAQITLFDSKGIERAERLVFINKEKQLNIKVETDKEKYLPREKVKMTIKVTDDREMPIPASLSLAVTNDQLLSFADDKSGTILSQLLLQQDINEKIEEPAFYFDPKEEKASKALDFLMLTAGWRRFKWEQVTDQNLPQIKNICEKAIISGVVYEGNKNLPLKGVVVKNSGTELCKTNENGEFSISGLDLYAAVNLEFSYPKYNTDYRYLNSYSQGINVTMYPYNPPVTYSKGGGFLKFARKDNVMVNAEEDDFRVKREEGAVIDDFRDIQFMMAEDDDAPGMVMAAGEVVAPVADVVEIKNFVAVAEDKPMEKELAKVIDPRTRVAFEKAKQDKMMIDKPLYYRARVFSAPVYAKEEKNPVRNDFRTTIFWDGMLEIDRTGRKTIEFYNSDEISSFRATVEGISVDGLVGHTEKVFFTQLPFALSVKFPIEVITEDRVSIPLTLKNNTTQTLTGSLQVLAPDGLILQDKTEEYQSVASNSVKVLYLKYLVGNKTGNGKFSVRFTSSGLKDAFTQDFNIVPRGFPVIASFSGKDKEKDYTVNLQNVVKGSVKAELTAYPSVVSDILKGVESILREPSGCFEQTSVSSYPNLFVLDYLRTTETDNPKLIAMAENLIDKGYKRLVTFETKEKGYEWFGGAPAHEALTAYGLLQFNDMKNIYKVDQEMIDRTAKWLNERRDGKGGFMRNNLALDTYGRADEDITNAYIAYSLVEAGYRDFQKEVDGAYSKALENNDPYQLALMANAMLTLGDSKRANPIMQKLYNKQHSDGYWDGAKHSVTRSEGVSLKIETTSLAILAMIKEKNPNPKALQDGIKFLIASRSGYGMFGSTQGTILALKALTGYAKFAKKTDEAGSLSFMTDNKEVASINYAAGRTEPIVVQELEKFIEEGKNKLTVKFGDEVKNPLSYSLAVTWNTTLPQSSTECKVNLECKLNSHKVKTGETVRLAATLTNKTNEGLPMTIAILGLPAGTTAQPWQLKELQEKKVFDFYEVTGNNVIIYYRQMTPSEVKTINLDLKAEIPGEYEAPASVAYLYYTNEFKHWVAIEKLLIVE